MTTHASRDTTTGLEFEKRVSCKKDGMDLTKYKLYKYLDSQGINWTKIISRKLLPDEAYWNPTTKELTIFEKKYQEGKSKEAQCQFTVQSCEDICEIIIQKTCQIYKSRDIPEEK